MIDNAEEIRLDRYLAAIWKAKWIVILGVVLAVAVAAVIAMRKPTLHSASALIEVGKVWGVILEDPNVTTEIVNSHGFIHELARQIGTAPGDLKRSILAEAVTAGPSRARYAILVRIEAKAEAPDEAVRRAGAVAESLIAKHLRLFDDALAPRLERQHFLERQIMELSPTSPASSRELLLALQSQLDEVRSNNVSPTETAKTRLVAPVVAVTAARPTPWRSIAFAGLVAATIGILAAAISAHFGGSVDGDSRSG